MQKNRLCAKHYTQPSYMVARITFLLVAKKCHLNIFCQHICVTIRNRLECSVKLIFNLYQEDIWICLRDYTLRNINFVSSTVRTDFHLASNAVVNSSAYFHYVWLTHQYTHAFLIVVRYLYPTVLHLPRDILTYFAWKINFHTRPRVSFNINIA